MLRQDCGTFCGILKGKVGASLGPGQDSHVVFKGVNRGQLEEGKEGHPTFRFTSSDSDPFGLLG